MELSAVEQLVAALNDAQVRLQTLLAMKKEAGRPQDLADLAALGAGREP